MLDRACHTYLTIINDCRIRTEKRASAETVCRNARLDCVLTFMHPLQIIGKEGQHCTDRQENGHQPLLCAGLLI